MSLNVEQSKKGPDDLKYTNGSSSSGNFQDATNRLAPKHQTLNEMYDPPGKTEEVK